MPRAALLLPLALAAIAPGRAVADDSARHPVAPRREARAAARSDGSAGTWLGAGGVAAALAAFGAVSLAARRAKSGPESRTLRIVGRASLSPRHAIHLVRVGDRTLILGTGPQGAPALLGELEEAIPEPVPAPAVRADAPAPNRPHAPSSGLVAERRGGTP